MVCQNTCHLIEYTKDETIKHDECQCEVCECGHEETLPEVEEDSIEIGKPIC